MSATVLDVDTSNLEVDAFGDEVGLEIVQHAQQVRGYIDIRLTPGEAVALSRALVKAAAEALGTEV